MRTDLIRPHIALFAGFGLVASLLLAAAMGERSLTSRMAGDSNLASVTAPVTLSDRVVLTMTDGTTHVFLKSEAVDKGSFVSPAGFTVRNLCDTSTLPHMTVCFRPDADGTRDEVVFEYGTFMQQPTTTGPYTATFYGGMTKLGSQSVPNHFFYQRWRWVPQGYRLRYRTIASLEAARLLPPYRKGVDPAPQNDAVPLEPDASTKLHCTYQKPFDSACVTKYMGSTGERDDIGFITGVQGKYLLTQSDDWWSIVLAQAEAGSGIPWHIRDEGGTPINFYRTGQDVVDRRALNSHSSNVHNTATYLPRPPYNFSDPSSSHGWAIDQAHQPALFYLPWLLTGDPYYLEGMQFANSNNTLYTAWDRRVTNLADLSEDQVRGIAWNLRTMFGLVATTPEQVPGWLLPRSYFDRQSRENVTKFQYKYLDESTNLARVLDSMSAAFWQQDFITTIVGWGVWMGRSEWQPVYTKSLKNAFARVNGTSGWERRCPTVYYVAGADSAFATWASAWQSELTLNNRIVPTDPSLLCEVTAYSSYLLGALAIATHNQVPNADGYHRWYRDMMQRTLVARGGYTMGPKWAIAPTYMLDGTLPPLPDVIDATSPPPSVGDTTPPSAPGQLSGVAQNGDIILSWGASVDNVAVTGYRVFRNNAATPVASVAALSYRDTAVVPDTQYTYTVVAIDAAGNQSAASNAVIVKTPPAKDTMPPSLSTALISNISSSGATISWTTNEPSTTALDYGINNDVTQQQFVTGLRTAHSVTVSGLAPSTLYYVRPHSTDASGNKAWGATVSFTTTALPHTGNTKAPSIEIVSVAGDFSVPHNTCTSFSLSVPCELSITFVPKTAGEHAGTLTLKDTYTGSTKSIALRGVATLASENAPPTESAESISAHPSSSSALVGTARDDVLTAGDGVVSVDGREGYDTVRVAALPSIPAHRWRVTKNSKGEWIVVESHGTGYTIVLTNIEAVVLSDGTTITLDAPPTRVTRSGDTVTGTESDDVIDVIDGVRIVDGGGGFDIVHIYAVTGGNYADWWRFTQQSDGSWHIDEVHATGYRVVLRNVEEVRIGSFSRSLIASTHQSSAMSIFSWLFSKIVSLFSEGSHFATALFAVSQQSVTFESIPVGRTATKTITVTVHESGVSVGGGAWTPFTRTLRHGSTHKDVRRLQEYLVLRSYLAQEYVTGYFDTTTETSLKQYQCDKAIVCNGERRSAGWGVFNKKTRDIVNKDLGF